MIIHNRLKELRAKYGLTQEELAHEVGVTRQTIIAIEQDTYLPSLSLAFRLCGPLHSSIEEMFFSER